MFHHLNSIEYPIHSEKKWFKMHESSAVTICVTWLTRHVFKSHTWKHFQMVYSLAADNRSPLNSSGWTWNYARFFLGMIHLAVMPPYNYSFISFREKQCWNVNVFDTKGILVIAVETRIPSNFVCLFRKRKVKVYI